MQLTSYSSEFIKGEQLTTLLGTSSNRVNTLEFGTGGEHSPESMTLQVTSYSS